MGCAGRTWLLTAAQLTLGGTPGPGELSEDGEGAESWADAAEAGDGRGRWRLRRRRDGAAAHPRAGLGERAGRTSHTRGACPRRHSDSSSEELPRSADCSC